MKQDLRLKSLRGGIFRFLFMWLVLPAIIIMIILSVEFSPSSDFFTFYDDAANKYMHSFERHFLSIRRVYRHVASLDLPVVYNMYAECVRRNQEDVSVCNKWIDLIVERFEDAGAGWHTKASMQLYAQRMSLGKPPKLLIDFKGFDSNGEALFDTYQCKDAEPVDENLLHWSEFVQVRNGEPVWTYEAGGFLKISLPIAALGFFRHNALQPLRLSIALMDIGLLVEYDGKARKCECAMLKHTYRGHSWQEVNSGNGEQHFLEKVLIRRIDGLGNVAFVFDLPYHIYRDEVQIPLLRYWVLLFGGILLIALASWRLWKMIDRPLLNIYKVIEEISKTNKPVALDGLVFREFYEMGKTLNEMAEKSDRALKKLEERQNYLECLLESIPSGLFTVDRNHIIKSWNKAAEHITGLSALEMIGRDCSILRGVLCDDSCPAFDDSVPKPIVDNRVRFVKDDGSVIVLSKNLNVLRDQDGKVDMVIESFIDLTELARRTEELKRQRLAMLNILEDIKSARDELERKAGELQMANEQLEEASRMKSEFLASTSHELRTPLNSIIGFSQAILEGLTTSREEDHELIADIYKSATHLLNIINDILDIAKIEAGKMELDMQRIDLREVLDDVYRLTYVMAEDKGLEYSIDYVGDSKQEPIFVNADKGKLKQILLNLVGNALKFTEQGSVHVEVEKHGRLNLVEIRVIDTGPGIPKDKQHRLFQKFSQIDGSYTRKHGGTGLGLAISKSLVELMGGSISVFSEGEGKGATFKVVLPLWQDADPQNKE